MLKEFREFIMRGNVLNLAVGIIIGTAFTAIVSSLVADIIMPIISIFLRGIDFSNIFIALDSNAYTTLQEAKDAGAGTINIGLFINALINFLIVAFVVFMMVRFANNLVKKKEEAPAEPPAPDPQVVLQERLLETLEKLNATLDKK